MMKDPEDILLQVDILAAKRKIINTNLWFLVFIAMFFSFS
jgi:hypothetical protein